MHRYCLVQYSFKGGVEHPVAPPPHGNSRKKDTQQYVRTWDSTKKKLREESGRKQPREAVHDVLDQALGGIQACPGLGQIPRNRQQAKDLLRKQAKGGASNVYAVKNISANAGLNDPWYCLLNESKVQARKKSTAFIRDVRVGAEPFCVLVSQRQLMDLQRFCCNLHEFRPLTVDPTFDIGKFNVTPISYQNLMLHTKEEEKHPTLIGPLLIHEKKTKETYSLFCGTLRSLNPELSKLLAYGTDDKEALISAFEENFERSTHLLCTNHLQKNAESRLVQMEITGKVKQDILADIFGRQNGPIYESGLCDADSDEIFQQQMLVLKEKWATYHPNGSMFFEWFTKNKSAKFTECDSPRSTESWPWLPTS